jgi:polyisoprenoid-binding protein YceI
MKKAAISLISGVALLLPVTFANAADTFDVDPSHTYPYFEVNHLGFSTLRGRFNETSGTFTLDMKNKTGSVDIVVKVASIDTAHEKRDKHLRSPDFFNAAEFPNMTFKSKKVTINDDKTAKVDGEVTIMGVTKPLTLDVKSINCGTHPFNKKEVCGFDAEAKLKRSDFGMNYGLPGIGDEITLLIEMEGFKK